MSPCARLCARLTRIPSYMTPDDYEEFSMAANQEYVGVGIEVGQFSGRIIISQVFEQGSAGAGGILAGDFIVGVDESRYA